MSKQLCVIGGTGFIGSHLVFRLANAGHSITVPTRRRERHRQFLVLPNVRLVEISRYDSNTLQHLFDNTDCVINLVGILNEHGHTTFRAAHVELTQRIIAAMQASRARRLLHMSALNADATLEKSEYLRTKGEAENLVMQKDNILATVFRPSVVFGPGDSFFNRFAELLRITPLVFPLACPNSRFSPVYVGDVVEAFRFALEDERSAGRKYDLCGPNTYSLRELVAYTAAQIGVKRSILGLSDALSRLQALVLGMLPGKPFSMDNYYSLQIDSVCRHSAFAEMGISPHSIESIVPGYLGAREPNARYQQFRRHSRRAG